ncbi:hypothetical protein FGG08_003611 [Glutinoglossum americanum]|uniref:DUF1857-domain-containing protein n=1 Tax=Glutinoglossum americanum TaxID=1670608 RepID=A0A9P8I7D1_9PEZI|nr:hypothetical protein FGG08_003611 [Glutinoglossum americanum]
MLFPFAYTVPINPPSASPMLTKDEVWSGLIKKARRAQDYIPIIDHCEIVSEDKDGLVRDVNIKPGFFMPEGLVREEVKWVEKVRLDYTIKGDSPRSIVNLLSEGGGEGELYLTFIFEFNKDVEPGSQEEADTWALYHAGAKKSVEHTVKIIREKKAQELL